MKLKIQFFILAIVLFFFSTCKKENKFNENSTKHENSLTFGNKCVSSEVLQRQILANPEMGKHLSELERKTQLYKGRDRENVRLAGPLYVQVVVHVVLKNPFLVTDAQIASQIAILNNDFNKENVEVFANPSIYLGGYPWESVANCDIHFILSQIVRKKTTRSSFNDNDNMKRTSDGGSDPICPESKLNIWVCNLSGGILGYAYAPGGDPLIDGVVLDYQAFGTQLFAGYSLNSENNLGRTATHEIGHWLNLNHIWGPCIQNQCIDHGNCGDDGVADTHAQRGATFGSCATLNGAVNQCTVPQQLKMWMNYMDYTDDGCLYMFTNGQKIRMDAAIDGLRAAYFSTTPTGNSCSEILSFDEVIAPNSGFVNASAYLSSHGITVSNISPSSTQVAIFHDNALYGGEAIIPTSPPNIITQGGSNGPVSFQLNFNTPLRRFTFKRVGLFAGPNGITHPAWTVKAYNSSHVQIGVVSEGILASYINIPSATYVLNGPDIAYIIVEADNVWTAFSSVIMDDFFLEY
jgi:hypothetical protein